MAEPRLEQVITPRVKVIIDTWDWNKGEKSGEIDITKQVLRYTFQKTIKSTEGVSTITLTPIINGDNALNVLNSKDVVRIIEYDITKYVGYIEDVNYSIVVNQDGKISTGVSISAKSIGNIVAEASVGASLGVLLKQQEDLLAKEALVLMTNLLELVNANTPPTYAVLIRTIINSMFNIVEAVGVTSYRKFFDYYFDFETAITSKFSYSLPKTATLFYGSEEQLTLWSLITPLIESPLMEMWFDTGKRNVSIDKENVAMADGKQYLVVRNTPFNGTAHGDRPSDYFTSLEEYKVTADMCVSINIGKSCREAYSVFTAMPTGLDMSNLALTLFGTTVKNQANLNKYLYKPLTLPLFFTRKESFGSNSDRESTDSLDLSAQDISETLKNWFENNDTYMNGVVKIVVPNKDDIPIGTKVYLEPVQGYFYCEGVTHTYVYSGGLSSDLVLTRGVDKSDGPIKLKDRIFRIEQGGER
jgi:hypothetical protein